MAKSQKKRGEKTGKRLIWIILAGLLVVIVVLGVYLIPKFFSGGGLTDSQLNTELTKSLSGNNRIAVYPSTKLIEVKQDANGWVGLGIKNIFVTSANNTFSYSITLSKVSGCSVGISKATAESWITTGKTGDKINIPSLDFSVQKVYLKVPANASLCTVRYGVFVKAGAASYANSYFDVKIGSKD